jgi:hypothetical protein
MVTCSKDGFVQYANIIDDNSSGVDATIHKITTNNNNTNINNTAFGNGALKKLQFGFNNTALGYNAGNNLIQGSNNIYIGNTGKSNEINTIRIGNSTDHTDAIISSNSINLQTNSLLLNGNDGNLSQVISVGETGSPEWRDELVVKNNNIRAGTNVFDNLTTNSSTPYIYVCGNYLSTLTLTDFYNNTQSTFPFSGVTGVPSTADTFLIKYSDNGNYIWGTRIGGSLNEQPSMFVLDTNNNVYVYGVYNSSTLNIPTIASFSGGSNDTYLIKYNDNGDVLWANNVGGAGGDLSKKMVVDMSNNIYITGIYNSSQVNIQDAEGFNGLLTNPGTNYSTYLIKYDSNGSIQWSNRIGGVGISENPNVSIDSSNNVYLHGNYTGTITINGQFGSAIVIGSSGGIDAYIVKFNSNGNMDWTNRINGF